MLLRNWFEHLKTSCNLHSLRTVRRSPLRKRPFGGSFQAAEVMEVRCLLSAGALDPTFGSGGVASPATSINGNAAAVAVYSTAQTATAGDVVAAGTVALPNGNHDFGVVRYTASGKPDLSFNKTGEAVTAFKSYGNAQAQDVAIQGDGKIVAAGYASGTSASGNSYDFALARYNANGSLDGTFGSGGIVTTNFSGSGNSRSASYDWGQTVVIQPDGKVVLAGITSLATAATLGPGNNIALARYNANGTLDTSFGTGGMVITPHAAIPGSLVDVSQGDTHVADMVLQSDGKLLVGGWTQVTKSAPNVPGTYDVFVARFNSDGTLDTSFGNGGFVTLMPVESSFNPNPGQQAMGHLALQSNGEILLTGEAQLALLHADGSIDKSFGNSGTGVVTTPLFGGQVALEPDGTIAVSGYSWVNGVLTPEVSRFLPGGGLDTTFGTGGVANTGPGIAIAIQADGKIDLAGTGFVVDRLLPGEPQAGSLTAGINPDGTVTLTASNFIDDNPNASITQVAFYAEDSSGVTTLLGYGSQSSPGAWTFTASLSPGTYTLSAQAEDSYGVIGDPLGIVETLN